MGTLVEIVVSDYAAEGDDAQADLTYEEMENYAKMLAGMRLTYDHNHPAHSTDKRPIKEHVTVANIKDAWVENDCVHINALLDSGPVGEKILGEIKSKFLTGCSLGLRHKLLKLPDGTLKHQKELIECSITPKPEFPSARIVGVRKQIDDGGAVDSCKAAAIDMAVDDNDNRATVLRTTISASSGERDEATQKHSEEILRELQRVRTPAKMFEPQTDAVARDGVQQKSVRGSDNFSRAPSKKQSPAQAQKQQQQQQQKERRQKMDIDGQEANYADIGDDMMDEDYDAKIADLVARRTAAQAQRRQQAPPPQQQQRAPAGLGQGPFRRGYAEMGGPPIHVHNHFGAQQELDQRRMTHSSIDAQGNFRQRTPRRKVLSRGGPQFDNRERDFERPDPSPQQVKYDRAAIERETRAPKGPAGLPRTLNREDAARLEELDRQRMELLGVKVNRHSIEDEEDAEDEDESGYSRKEQRQGGKRRRGRYERETSRDEDGYDDDDNDEDVEDKLPPRRAANKTQSSSLSAGSRLSEADALRKEMAEMRREMLALRNAPVQAKVDSLRSKLAAPADSDRDALREETRDAVMETDDALGNLATLESQMKENDSGEIEAIADFRRRRDTLAQLADQMKDADRQIVEARSADAPDPQEIAKLREQKSKLLAEYKQKTRDIGADAMAFISRMNVAARKATPAGIRKQMTDLIGKNSRASLGEVDNAISLVELVSASSGVSANTLKDVREQMARLTRENLEKSEALRERRELEKTQAEKEGAAAEVARHDRRKRAQPYAIGGSSGQSASYDKEGLARAAQAAVKAATGETIGDPYEEYQGWDSRTMLPVGKDFDKLTMQEKTGLPYNFIENPAPMEIIGQVTKDCKFRQKHPGDVENLTNVPKDGHMRIRHGMHRTGDKRMLDMVRLAFGTNARRKNNMMISAGTYRNERLKNMRKPRGAELREDPQTGLRYFVLGN